MKLTALYERLSIDDDSPGESVSIRNQKTMLEEYARHAEFLYSSLGRNFYITELEGYAFWAKED